MKNGRKRLLMSGMRLLSKRKQTKEIEELQMMMLRVRLHDVRPYCGKRL
jgi:hypothetical protein